MRKYISLLLLITLALLALGGCFFDKPAASVSPGVETPGLDADTAAALQTQDSVIEYGEPAKLVSDGGPLMAYISYPYSTGFADEALASWAQDALDAASGELERLLQTDKSATAEINVHFDSYFTQNRYAGILEKGIYTDTASAHPRDIIKTFNLDVESKTLLQNDDILDFSLEGQILELLRGQILAEYPDEKASLAEISTDWLANLLIGHDGIIVVLERGVCLPSYLGAQTITLSYEKLGAALKLGKTEPSPEPPAPSPAPSPEASPSPPPATPVAPPSAPPQNDNIDPAKPMLALTFDDGPSKFTAHILDLLEQYNSRATFFVVGNVVNVRTEVVKRAFDLGCEIGGHSWSHRDLSKLSEEEIRAELANTSDAVKAITGVAPGFYRPPYGATNATVKSVSADLNLPIICWSVDTLDWKTRNADAVYEAVMKEAADKAIILLHDLHGTTAEAMDRVIPALLEQGYQLVTVSELMRYSDKAMQAGLVYYSGK